jgi:hypothetical protein
MDETTQEVTPAADGNPVTLLNLGAWLGRHQAFGMIANRCSAADAECLKNMRNSGEYRKLGLTWDEFCQNHAGISRTHADRLIGYLDEFGADYFRLAEVMQISPETFRLIADSVGENGIEFNGLSIPINRENRRKILAAVQAARATSESKPARLPKVAAIRKRLDTILSDARAIAETSAQRAELMVLLDQGLEQLTQLAEDLRRNTIIVE